MTADSWIAIAAICVTVLGAVFVFSVRITNRQTQTTTELGHVAENLGNVAAGVESNRQLTRRVGGVAVRTRKAVNRCRRDVDNLSGRIECIELQLFQRPETGENGSRTAAAGSS